MKSQQSDSQKPFEFGKNWQHFLSVVDDSRICLAQESLKALLGVENLTNKRFLDAGSGSGLFSLAARRLGANVHSFDYDIDAVRCVQELKRRYAPDDPDWTIEQGSVLDESYLQQLGQFDCVYSWGVLHHTGNMWAALKMIIPLVAMDGQLFISIYNDQGWRSKLWRRVKATYCSSPAKARIITLVFLPYYVSGYFVKNLLRGKVVNPFALRHTTKDRGMSFYYDIVDWLGGYPFEVATPEQCVDFFQQRGFETVQVVKVGNKTGCNEFVFKKVPPQGANIVP